LNQAAGTAEIGDKLVDRNSGSQPVIDDRIVQPAGGEAAVESRPGRSSVGGDQGKPPGPDFRSDLAGDQNVDLFERDARVAPESDRYRFIECDRPRLRQSTCAAKNGNENRQAWAHDGITSG
jgi:hypothetical protein